MSWVGLGVAATTATVGAIQSHQKGKKQERQAAGLKAERDAAFNSIPLEDPRQTQILEEVRRRRRAFETGTAFSSELRNIRSAQAGTQQSIQRIGAGGGATLAALSRVQLATNKSIADIGLTSQKIQLNLTDKIAAQSNLITKRKDQLKVARFSQISAEAAQKQKESNANLNAAQAQLTSLGGQAAGAAVSGATSRKRGDIGSRQGVTTEDKSAAAGLIGQEARGLNSRQSSLSTIGVDPLTSQTTQEDRFARQTQGIQTSANADNFGLNSPINFNTGIVGSLEEEENSIFN